MIEPSMQFMSELPPGQIRPMKVRYVRTITSFNSYVNDLSVQFMSEINCFRD